MNLHQFGVRFTEKPMNFISTMSGSDGNSVMERAAMGKFGMSWHSTGPLYSKREDIEAKKGIVLLHRCVQPRRSNNPLLASCQIE